MATSAETFGGRGDEKASTVVREFSITRYQISNEQMKSHLECQKKTVQPVWEHLLAQLEAETLQRREVVASEKLSDYDFQQNGDYTMHSLTLVYCSHTELSFQCNILPRKICQEGDLCCFSFRFNRIEMVFLLFLLI